MSPCLSILQARTLSAYWCRQRIWSWKPLKDGGFLRCPAASGIYGPDRCHALQRLLSGMVQLELPGDRWVNMIHQQDVVRAILATFIHGPAGSVFNVSDDCPVAQKELS